MKKNETAKLKPLKNILDDIKLIGITGGIGSGKSTVANLLIESGYKVISSDDNAKYLMNNDLQLILNIKSEFGEDFYLEGKVNTLLVASTIFKSKEKLDKLNQLVHPKVIELMLSQLEELVDYTKEMVFVESALMFESGLFVGFDYIIDVYTKKETAIERVVKRSGITEKEVLERMSMQMDIDKKKSLADFVIENNKSEEELSKSLWSTIDLIRFLPKRENFDED
jgi:dephospho-CoA kinase